MSGCDFVVLRPSMIVPIAAFEAIAALERAGHSVVLDGLDILVERGKGMSPLDPASLAELRRWKPHCRMLLAYVADDRHLREKRASRYRASDVKMEPRDA